MIALDHPSLAPLVMIGVVLAGVSLLAIVADLATPDRWR